MAYQFESRVRYSETDMKQKLSLVALADYFQDCSTFQSESLGRGIQYLKERQRVWVILSWQIEILRRPDLGEKILVRTWPHEFRAFYGHRNFALLDEQENYLAKANSVWVLLDTETGRPVKPDPEHISMYGMEPPLDMEYSSRKVQVTGEGIRKNSFSVCRHHLDSNNHVNNGQYIYMAEEYLPSDFEVKKLKVEYRRQAHLHDVIVPVVYRNENEITVSLCDEEEKPYAIVCFAQGTGSFAGK